MNDKTTDPKDEEKAKAFAERVETLSKKHAPRAALQLAAAEDPGGAEAYRRCGLLGEETADAVDSGRRPEASRRAAQQALLAALRQIYSDPLVELRDRPAEPAPASSRLTDEPPARSKDRQEAIRRATRRVQALAPIADPPPGLAFDFDAWADR